MALDFSSLQAIDRSTLLPLQSFRARDGEQLAFRLYPCDHEVTIVLLHGSGYHGAYLHLLAQELNSIGQVIVPNLRGHNGSGSRQGDLSYIGQLEDDLVDLLDVLGVQRVHLVGHSSGGGLAIRAAGGVCAKRIKSYTLLCPVIPTANIMKPTATWAQVRKGRLNTILVLNALGIRWFNHLPIISFDMPTDCRDGTETLEYSFALNLSYHPRYKYQQDIDAMGERYLVLMGDADEVNDANQVASLFGDRCVLLPGVHHLELAVHPRVLERTAAWIQGCET